MSVTKHSGSEPCIVTCIGQGLDASAIGVIAGSDVVDGAIRDLVAVLED